MAPQLMHRSSWSSGSTFATRKLHTEAFIHVSDDKTHDSHAAQTFINKTLAYLDEHYVKTGKETFVALHMHSDNAPSHFKSSKTMYFFTTLVATLKQWGSAVLHRSFRIVWEFGAPGHGKGVWDGIGAWMKRTGLLPLCHCATAAIAAATLAAAIAAASFTTTALAATTLSTATLATVAAATVAATLTAAPYLPPPSPPPPSPPRRHLLEHTRFASTISTPILSTTTLPTASLSTTAPATSMTYPCPLS